MGHHQSPSLAPSQGDEETREPQKKWENWNWELQLEAAKTLKTAKNAPFWWSIEFFFFFLDDKSCQAASPESEMKNKYLKIGIMLYVLFKVTNDLCCDCLDCCCLIDLLTMPSTLTLELGIVCLLVFYLLVCFGDCFFHIHFEPSSHLFGSRFSGRISTYWNIKQI